MAKEKGYENTYTVDIDFEDLDQKAKKQRATYENIWADIELNFFPFKAMRQKASGEMVFNPNQNRMANNSSGKKTPVVSYDSSTAESVLNNSTAMATSYIVPATEAGLQLRVENGSDSINEQINIASKLIIDQLHQTGKHNSTLYQALYPAVKSSLCYGNGALIIEHQPDSSEPIISTLNIWDLYILTDEKTGQIHTVYRVTYDEDTKKEKTEIWRDLSYKRRHIPLVINNIMTYPISYRVYLDKIPTEETKLPVMPICIGRMFLEAGQVYGHGLGQRALLPARKFNALHRQLMLTADYLITPPYGYSDGMFDGPLDLKPGASNKMTPNINGNPFIPLMAIPPTAMSALREAMAIVEQELRSALMEKELMLPADTLDKMTATAANLWAAQANSLIAPALIGMTSSILHNMARIQLYRLLERGEIKLDGIALEKIQYFFLTKQDMMRRQVDANIKDQNIAKMAQIAQIIPSIGDAISWDTYVAESFREAGVQETYFRSDEDIEEIQSQRARQQQQADMQAQAAQAAQANIRG
jgi:hypothetical protein